MWDEDQPLPTLVERADQSLYEDKATARTGV
jgi:hypothetical protein